MTQCLKSWPDSIPIYTNWRHVKPDFFHQIFQSIFNRASSSRISPRSYPPTTERVDFIICGLKKSCLYQHHWWWEGLELFTAKVAPVVKVQLESSNLSISYQNCLYTYSYYMLYELSIQHNHAYYNYIIQCVCRFVRRHIVCVRAHLFVWTQVWYPKMTNISSSDVKRWNGRPSEKSEKNNIRTQHVCHVYRIIPFCWVCLTSQNSQVPHRISQVWKVWPFGDVVWNKDWMRWVHDSISIVEVSDVNGFPKMSNSSQGCPRFGLWTNRSTDI